MIPAIRNPRSRRVLRGLRNYRAWLPAVVFCINAGLGLAHAAPRGFHEEDTRFRSGSVLLKGTVLLPSGRGPHPAMVMVHGAGSGLRRLQRREAEAFAQAGIVTLIYDKRTEGYSASGLGSRSYELLADDALAAVRTLRARAGVSPTMVGLWGLSEGAWVASLAASRSNTVAFLVLVGASGVPPAQQEAWRLENALRHEGVSGSLLEAATRTFMRLLVAAELFPEATHDPVPVLARVRQPVLALWGALDRVAVPAESARIMRNVFERSGNRRYTFRFFSNADHDLHASPDGFVKRTSFAPGYLVAVASWINGFTRGEVSGPSVGVLPLQNRPSPAAVIRIPWYATGGWLQLVTLLWLVGTFAAQPVMALVYRLLGRSRRSLESRSARWSARWLAGSGLVTVLGLFLYLGGVMIGGPSAVGPLLMGQPLVWLALQILAFTACASTLILAASIRPFQAVLQPGERVRLTVLLLGGISFALWAWSWSLLTF